MDLGDVEAIQVSNSMFISVNQVSFLNAAGFGLFTNCGFDTFNGVGITNCFDVSFVGCYFSGGSVGGFTVGQNISQIAGHSRFQGCWFTNAASTMVRMAGGDMTIEGCRFNGGGNTNPFINQDDGGVGTSQLICSNNMFARASGVGGGFLINNVSGRMTANGNRCPIDGTGNFIKTSTNNFNKAGGNATGSWTNSLFAGGFNEYWNNI
jgi:hypothetical protein